MAGAGRAARLLLVQCVVLLLLAGNAAAFTASVGVNVDNPQWLSPAERSLVLDRMRAAALMQGTSQRRMYHPNRGFIER
jgi:hypothetical protein